MEKEWMKWYKILPVDLLNGAYKAVNGELAWPEEQALRVVDIINTSDYMISSVEPWLPGKLGPTPLIFDWRAGKHSSSNQFPNTPASFIEQFDTLHPLQNGQEPVFNICVQKK